MASRLKNSKRNLIFGLLSCFLGIATNFAVRTTLLYALGADYQGLNGLFNSILHILNLTDLGFTTAVIFVLYKPIADGDEEKICCITSYLRKVYIIIGIAIFALGMCILPFLKYLVNSSYPLDINIYILFLIYLINSSITYLFFGYKSTVLSAMQREDIVSKIHIIITTLLRITQIVSLIIFEDYYVFVALIPIWSIVNALFVQYLSKRYFPNIKPIGKIDNETKDVLKKQVGSIFLGRLGDIARNSFDDVFISLYLGLVLVAIYDNYFYIFSAIYGIMGIIIHAIQASVGNSIVTDSKEKNYEDLLKFNFIFMTFTGFCTICLFCLYQPFMLIWMKNDETMTLSFFNMSLFCVYFYAINMTYVRSMYLDGNGLFSERKWLFIFELIGNIVLNALLGYFFGITGILLASIITIIIFNYIGQNHVLFKHHFKRSIIEFYLNNLLYLFVTICVCGLTYLCCYYVPFGGILSFIIKIAVCVVVPAIAYVCIYFRYKYFKTSITIVKAMINKTRNA